MVLGAGGESISFGIRAVADLRGIEQTSRALTALAREGGDIGKGIGSGSSQATASLGRIEQASREAVRELDKVGAEGREAGRDLDRGMDQGAAAIGKAGDKADDLADRLNRVSNVSLAVGGAIFAGLGVAVKQASDLSESMSKTTVVFEDQADAIIDWSKDSARAMGISQRATLEVVGTFGALFTAMGVAPDASADMSKALVQLSADLASFNNMNPEDVFDALRAGISGESEPLKRFGVIINEAALKAELLAIGAEKVNGEFTEAAKVQARFNIIMRQTTTAQGDFARTSDGLANSTRIARAEIENAAAAIGTVFLPLVAEGATAVANVAGEFNALPAPVQSAVAQTVAAIGGIALATAGASRGIALLVTNAQRLKTVGLALSTLATGPAGLVIAAAAAAGALYLLYQRGTEQERQLKALKQATDDYTASIENNTTALANQGLLDEVDSLKAYLDTWIQNGTIAQNRIDLLNKAIERTATLMATGGGEGFLAGAFQDGGEFFDEQVDHVLRLAGAYEDGVVQMAELEAAQVALRAGFELTTDEAAALTDAMTAVNNAIANPELDGGKIASEAQQILQDMTADVITVEEAIKRLNALPTDREFNLAVQASTEDMIANTKAINDNINAQIGWNGKRRALDLGAADGIDDVTEAMLGQINVTDEQIAQSITSRKEQEALTDAVQRSQNAYFLASQEAEGLFLPFTRDADNAEKATDDFNRTLAEMQAEAINAAAGIADIAPELEGMQAGFGKAEDSVVDLFRAMDDAGVVDFSPAVREALDAVSALAKVEAQITAIEAAITNNQGDMAMWQGRIALVGETFGANTQLLDEWLDLLQTGQITQDQFNANVASLSDSGGFPKLDALLSQGKITQEEYNAAVEAGIHLLQRSAGGMQDEEAEIVRNIIALDEYVRAHDDADGAVNELTKEQRGLIAAMQDTAVQQYLATLQLLFYLASLDQIPEEKVTEFIVASGESNDVIAAINEDLGLVPETKETTVTVNYTTTGTEDEGGLKSGLPQLVDPDPVTLTADDQVTPVIEEATLSLEQFETDADTSGTDAGDNYRRSIDQSMADIPTGVQTVVDSMLGAMDISAEATDLGWYGGWLFGTNVVAGIDSNWNAIFNSGWNAGNAAVAGYNAAINNAYYAVLGGSGGSSGAAAHPIIGGAAGGTTNSTVQNITLNYEANFNGITDVDTIGGHIRAGLNSAVNRARAAGLTGS